MSPTNADAAIVIVNYRSSELVERCLASVYATCEGLALETVVIDNDSRDGSLERLRASLPQAQVVAMESNRGFAAGVNAGFALTSSELVLVLNPDTELMPGAVNALLERLRANPGTGVAGPLVEDTDGHISPNGYRRFPGLALLALDLCVPFSYVLSYAPRLHPYAMSPDELLGGGKPAHLSGAALAIRRAAYERAGPLDEGFFLYLEETEWQQRVAACGWAIEIVPRARVCHLVRGGGEAALAHSPYFVPSALRYLRLQGKPALLSRLVLSCSLAISALFLQALSWLPSKRAKARVQARAYRSMLWRTLRGLKATVAEA